MLGLKPNFEKVVRKKLNNMEKANEEMRVYLEQHKIEEVFVS